MDTLAAPFITTRTGADEAIPRPWSGANDNPNGGHGMKAGTTQCQVARTRIEAFKVRTAAAVCVTALPVIGLMTLAMPRAPAAPGSARAGARTALLDGAADADEYHRIYVLRHGNKEHSSEWDLSPCGWDRALFIAANYKKLFHADAPAGATAGVEWSFYGTEFRKERWVRREWQTLFPLAQLLLKGLYVTTMPTRPVEESEMQASATRMVDGVLMYDFSRAAEASMVRRIAEGFRAQSTQIAVIAWEHCAITRIVEEVVKHFGEPGTVYHVVDTRGDWRKTTRYLAEPGQVSSDANATLPSLEVPTGHRPHGLGAPSTGLDSEPGGRPDGFGEREEPEESNVEELSGAPSAPRIEPLMRCIPGGDFDSYYEVKVRKADLKVAGITEKTEDFHCSRPGEVARLAETVRGQKARGHNACRNHARDAGTTIKELFGCHI